jgi:putative ABC transport system permease protein
MSPLDLLGFTLLTLRRQRFRSLMLILSLALGVSSVTLLVSLGEAARGYVLGEFSLLGSDVLAVFPGRKSTSGGMPPVTGTAARDITLNDARIIEKTVPGVHAVAALVVGSAPASHEARERDTLILGTSAAFFDIRQNIACTRQGLARTRNR